MSLPTLHGYIINRQLAAGGMAKIYDATQVSLNRPVAIKFLSKTLLDHHEALSLFERESLIIAQLNHPNIIQVIDKGISADSQPYFVMEKINGIDLSEMILGAELPFSKKIDIAIQICKGLSYAHKNSVIHRDIKPSNIIIDQHGNARILDFGIALSESDQQPEETAILGTAGYIAPEQEQDYAQATIASDIYSFGMVLKKLFSKADDLANLSEQEKHQIPEPLIKLLFKCIATEPSMRPNSLNEVRDSLLRISKGSHLAKTKFEQAQAETQDLSTQFSLLDILCKTKQKRVYLFQKKSNQQLIVIKRTLGSTQGLKQAKILSSLKHPNIVQVYAAAKSGGNFILISEYLSGGSLANVLLQNMSEQDFLTQACQICVAIHFAHQNNIQHNNLSPENILFDSRQNIKITDFGQRARLSKPITTSIDYHPPGQQAYSEQYDIYCMGAIFHHMLYGVPIGEELPKRQQKLSFRLQKLIDKMVAIDPINRPTTAQQVLVELQRIARSGLSKAQSSNISKNRKEARKKPIEDKQARHNASKPTTNIYLVAALTVSFIIIVGLLLKDLS
ncbi:MAG: protein kinase [Kangiellaceae bacterium]|nr:protein kinase [Kangiellaceae bacterium]